MLGNFATRFLLKKSKMQRAVAKLLTDMPPHVMESYKILRTNLLFALATTKNKAVVISSSSPFEGKSSTCANLAIAMAQTGSKVILIDADLRKPTQHRILKCQNNTGLATILAGFNELDEVIVQNVKLNLDIITSGPTPPNPSELLGSEQMSKLIDTLNNRYDYIFIDTPPINIVTDAIILSRIAAGVVLVTRQGQSAYDDLTKAVSSVEFAGASILGFVINCIKEKSTRYGKYTYE